MTWVPVVLLVVALLLVLARDGSPDPGETFRAAERLLDREERR